MDLCQPLLVEVKLIGCSAINWFCTTNSWLQRITGPGTACQDKRSARGKKGPVGLVFTGVLTLIREERETTEEREACLEKPRERAQKKVIQFPAEMVEN